MKVTKRDGSFENYSVQTVKRAVREAFKSTKTKYSKDTISNIVSSITPYDGIPVEEIQDQIETSLYSHDQPKVAKEFILYRNKKKEIREWVANKEAFIERYKNASNTANSTIDDNSNVSSKNIGVLNAEIHKGDNILVSRGMITRKLKELFPNFKAKQYQKDLKNHIIYKNDESSFAGAISPYTYSSKEVIYVKYNDKPYLIPFDLLYDLIEEPEVFLDHERIVYQKFPDNLYVYDDNDTWTQVTHVTKKKRHRDLVRVKTTFGEDIVVTDNHPLIIDKDNIDDCIDAIDSVGKRQYKTDTKYRFEGNKTIDLSDVLTKGEVYNTYIKYNKQPINRFINIDRDFGYLVGFFVGDGNYINTSDYLNFTQKDVNILYKLNDILFTHFGIIGKIVYKSDNSNCYNLFVNNRAIYELFRNYFKIQDKSQGKTIPVNIFSFNDEFALGILEGLLDSDGTIHNNSIYYRLSSRAGILQISALLKYFGYSVCNAMQTIPFGQNSGYHTNYTVWGVNTTYKDGLIKLSNSIKFNKVTTSTHSSKYNANGETTVLSVLKINENDAFLNQNEYIYDITTKTHTFALNNILVHNCVSVSMYPFLNHGLEKIGGLSCHPQNLDSYCGMYVNLVFAVAAQFAGAVATSEFLVYFDYFARKEFGDDYYLHSKEFYKIGPKYRKLLNESNYWCKDVDTLRKHDFGTDELNKLRDELVYNSERPLSDEELKEYETELSKYDVEGSIKDFTNPIKIGDGTRTIGSCIQQFFQQVV